MIGAIALLLVCQLAGEVIHRLTGLPLPGSVIGMVLLLGWLAFVPKERLTLTQVTGWLTAHLSIMFVPAADGVMEEGAILSRQSAPSRNSRSSSSAGRRTSAAGWNAA